MGVRNAQRAPAPEISGGQPISPGLKGLSFQKARGQVYPEHKAACLTNTAHIFHFFCRRPGQVTGRQALQPNCASLLA
eukprot:scaffold113847_cov18-Tisochrysis_lutea.AAC.1